MNPQCRILEHLSLSGKISSFGSSVSVISFSLLCQRKTWPPGVDLPFECLSFRFEWLNVSQAWRTIHRLDGPDASAVKCLVLRRPQESECQEGRPLLQGHREALLPPEEGRGRGLLPERRGLHCCAGRACYFSFAATLGTLAPTSTMSSSLSSESTSRLRTRPRGRVQMPSPHSSILVKQGIGREVGDYDI
jgi:hypothetical protein